MPNKNAVKTWSSSEVLTAADLNLELTNARAGYNDNALDGDNLSTTATNYVLGGLKVGSATGVTTSANYLLQHLGTGAADSGMTLGRWSVDASGSTLSMVKSRNATIGNSTILADNDVVGTIEYMAADGGDLATPIASIVARVDDASPAANQMGGELVFTTTAANANTVTERLRIGADGKVSVTGDADIDGTLETDALSIASTAVTSTAAELNILDGVTSTAAELNILDGVTATAAEINKIAGGTARVTDAVASGDGILINDAGAMKMTNVDTVSTYFASHSVGGTNIATVGTIGTGTWQGTPIASAYLDSDTAHLTGTQTISGDKTFTGDLTFTNTGFALGSDATGDLYYRNASGNLARLAASTDGHVLTATGAGAVPAWEAPSSGGISWDGSTADGVATYKDGDEATVESTWTYSSTQDMAINSSTAHKPEIVLTNTHSDADSAPVIKFKHDKGANGAASDAAGQIYFLGDTDNQTNVTLGRIDSCINGAGNSDYSGRMDFHVARAASFAPEPQDGSDDNAPLSLQGTNTSGRIDVAIGAGSASRVYARYMMAATALHVTEAGASASSSNYGVVETTATSAGMQMIRATASNASYTADMAVIICQQSDSDTYNFFCAYSNGGTDREFELAGDGDAFADGSWSGSGADFAEYFEAKTGGALEVGKCVVMDGDKVRLYADTDDAADIIGVVRPKEDSKTGAIIGNTAWNHWQDRYLTDDYGRYLREDREVVTWEHPDGPERDPHAPDYDPEKGHGRERTIAHYADSIPDDVTVPDGAVRSMQSVRKQNPDYDEDREYAPREDRDEWALIGLLGQVPVKAGETVPSRWIKMKAVSDAVEMYLVR